MPETLHFLQLQEQLLFLDHSQQHGSCGCPRSHGESQPQPDLTSGLPALVHSCLLEESLVFTSENPETQKDSHSWLIIQSIGCNPQVALGWGRLQSSQSPFCMKSWQKHQEMGQASIWSHVTDRAGTWGLSRETTCFQSLSWKVPEPELMPSNVLPPPTTVPTPQRSQDTPFL